MRTRYFVALIIVLMVGRVADILVHEADPDDDLGAIIIIGTSPWEGVSYTVVKPKRLDDVADMGPALRERILAVARERAVESLSIGVLVWYSAPLTSLEDGVDRSADCVDVVDLGSGRTLGTFVRPRSSRQWDWQPAS